jgi:hypothetical protein
MAKKCKLGTQPNPLLLWDCDACLKKYKKDLLLDACTSIMIDDTQTLCEACEKSWHEVANGCKVSAKMSRKQCEACLSGSYGKLLKTCSNNAKLPVGFSLLAFANKTFCAPLREGGGGTR